MSRTFDPNIAMHRTFEIKTYEVHLARVIKSLTGSATAVIVCKGGAGERFDLYFSVTSSTVPNNTSDLQMPFGTSWLTPEQYARYLDLLRNESPVYATISENPEHNTVTTGAEPVGSGELHEGQL